MEAGGLTCLRFPSSPRAQSHCETVERVYYILVVSKCAYICCDVDFPQSILIFDFTTIMLSLPYPFSSSRHIPI